MKDRNHGKVVDWVYCEWYWTRWLNWFRAEEVPAGEHLAGASVDL